MSKRNTAGFTLAELLIVVAIIAVLVAIAIPIFTNQLEKSREATDLANVRAAYAQVMTAAISDDAGAKYDGVPVKQNDGSFKAVVSPLVQQIDGWTMKVDDVSVGGVPSSRWTGEPKKNGRCTVIYDPADDSVTIDWTGGTSGESGGTGENTGNAPTSEQYQSYGNKLLDLIQNPNGKIRIMVDGDGKLIVDEHHSSASPDAVYNALKDQDGIEDRNGSLYINNTGNKKIKEISVNQNNGHGEDSKKIKITYDDESEEEIVIPWQ